jgi:diaminohydroxyphosphoribosylaminopyrimidine deaminase/5-amino-6-(5-phosphoribosylamino)uracil reductase
MVGAMLVNGDRIIGEGYHKIFGGPHAEVNCLNSVSTEDIRLIPQSTLYVSLEPCSHFGKTPPCADLIIEKKIPRVIIGSADPFKEVNGKGITRLKNAGIEVTTGVAENYCKEVNKRFFTFEQKHRPYIILKWAQTADCRIANADYSRIFITNEFSNRLVHRWRGQEAAILVGTNTALSDDPELTNRLWTGGDPVRLVVDMDLRLPSSLKIFNGQVKTIIFNGVRHEELGKLLYYQVAVNDNLVHQIVNACYQLKIQSLLVEGGARLLQSFIDEETWDEARVIENEQLHVMTGIPSPQLPQCILTEDMNIFSDRIRTYKPMNSVSSQ